MEWLPYSTFKKEIMNRELSDEELLYASMEDCIFYEEAIKGLPTRIGFKGNYLDKDNVEIPYGSGPHILRHFRETFEITKQHCVLEVGFNCGHGSAMMLELGATVDSIDISEKWETKYAALFLKNMYGGRFNYWHRKDFPMPFTKYGLIFIDGAHDEESVVSDIKLSKELDIPYLLMDDCYVRYGDALKAIERFPELELVKDMNNLKLYKWRS